MLLLFMWPDRRLALARFSQSGTSEESEDADLPDGSVRFTGDVEGAGCRARCPVGRICGLGLDFESGILGSSLVALAIESGEMFDSVSPPGPVEARIAARASMLPASRGAVPMPIAWNRAKSGLAWVFFLQYGVVFDGVGAAHGGSRPLLPFRCPFPDPGRISPGSIHGWLGVSAA